MTLPDLGTETEQLEFKKTTSEIKEAVISIAAILNKHGKGKLYFGVKTMAMSSGKLSMNRHCGISVSQSGTI